ncbi:MAG TPA: cytochrome c-type biogenesis protein, partial [Gammaproteobacteria bacterium]|nr:cytochrome c-type biogenesis protein [Gammaproteobacteria bacterium]
FLVQRYGDFVRFRPPVDIKTYALWFGPLLLLFAGGWLLARALRRQSQSPPPELSPEQRHRIDALLEDNNS